MKDEPRRPRRGRTVASASAKSAGSGAQPSYWLKRFELKADVDGRSRMRQCADGDERGTRGGELRHPFERHASGDFHRYPTVSARHRATDFFERQVVEQN